MQAIAELVGEKSSRRSGQPIQRIADRREEIPPNKFPTYWTRVLPELRAAFNDVCAYSCFRIHPVTGVASVDHFAPKSRHWGRVYEWANYRLACSRLNAWKSDYEDVLDPFEIESDWFTLELVGFRILASPHLSDPLRSEVENTISRLKLNEFCREREERAHDYLMGEVTWNILFREAPFVARELRRQGRLRETDIHLVLGDA